MKKLIELTDEQTKLFALNHHWEENPIVDIDGRREKNPISFEQFAISKIEEFIGSSISEQKKKEYLEGQKEAEDNLIEKISLK